MIIELKAYFLKREETKTREQLDAKDFKPFWDQLVDYALDKKNKDTILEHRFPFDEWVGNTFDTCENFYQAEGYEEQASQMRSRYEAAFKELRTQVNPPSCQPLDTQYSIHFIHLSTNHHRRLQKRSII